MATTKDLNQNLERFDKEDNENQLMHQIFGFGISVTP